MCFSVDPSLKWEKYIHLTQNYKKKLYSKKYRHTGDFNWSYKLIWMQLNSFNSYIGSIPV